MLEFGERIPGTHYVLRPGVYAVAFNDEGRVAVVRTPRGIYLPGGGTHPGEAAIESLSREIREECGLAVTIVRSIGTVVEYVHAPGEGHFAKECSFFEARLSPESQRGEEDDHTLEWMDVDQAIA